MQRRAARRVWVCWEGPNKHWDPERNQELPPPEGFTLLALAEALPVGPGSPQPPPPRCCRGDASFESSRHSHFARFDGTGLGSLAPGRARLEREDFPRWRSGIPQSSSSGKILGAPSVRQTGGWTGGPNWCGITAGIPEKQRPARLRGALTRPQQLMK